MPNEGIKISELPSASDVLDTDVVAGVGGGVTRKFAFSTIASYIQSKLSALFNAKQDLITVSGVLRGDGDGGISEEVFDPLPTQGSGNLIGSGAVYSALQDKADVASLPQPDDGFPRMDGTASGGTYSTYSRADHVHPSDTSKASKASWLLRSNSTLSLTFSTVTSFATFFTSNGAMVNVYLAGSGLIIHTIATATTITFDVSTSDANTLVITNNSSSSNVRIAMLLVDGTMPTVS